MKKHNYQKMARKYRIQNRHDVDGYIIFIGNVEPFSSKYQLRRIIVEMDAEGYKQEVPFDFVNERMRLAEGFALGQHVQVTFCLRGRGKLNHAARKVWYPSLEALNISRL